MRKLLLISLLIGCAVSAHAVTCAGVAMPSGITTCYYADATNGLDTNNGTSAATPWQHVPGMAICTSTCGSHTVTAGDAYLLMGNRVWTNTSLGILLATNGTSGNPIYYGNPQGSTFFTPIVGTANTSGTAVTWVSGIHGPGGGCLTNCNFFGDFITALVGQTITVNGGSCVVATVTDAQDLTCTLSQGTHTGVAFSINVFGRPVLDAGGTVMGSNAGAANIMMRPYANYLIIDDIEMRGLYWSGTVAAGTDTYIEYAGGTPGQGAHDEIKNMYIHGWSHDVRTSPTCTGETNLVLADTSVPNNNTASFFHDSIITGRDVNNSSGTSGAAFFGGPPILYRNWMEYVSDGGVVNGMTTVHDNSVFTVGPTFQITNACGGVAHTNAFEFNAQSTDYTVYNNVIAHLATGTLGLWTATNSGVNAHIFNNVIFDTDVGNILDPAQSVANNGCSAGATYCNVAGNNNYYNNTVECGPDSGPPSATCQGGNSALNAIVHQNGFYISSGAIYSAPPTPTLTTDLGSGNNGVPLSTACSTDGYCANQTFAFSPTSGSGITVRTGTSNTTFCGTVNTLDTTAGAACLKDATYGVAIDTTAWTVTGPARVALTRSTSTPSIGAYEFSGAGQASPATCTPASGVVPQTVTCTNPNSGTTVACYTTNGATPATNGAGTGCTTGTAYTTSLSISVAETLKIIAGTSTLTDSTVNSYTYTSGTQSNAIFTLGIL